MTRWPSALMDVRNWLVAQWTDLVETGFVLVALCGLALLAGVAWPLIVGGTLGVVACERASTTNKQRAQDKKPRPERVS